MKIRTAFALIVLLMLFSCSFERKEHVIGISLNDDIDPSIIDALIVELQKITIDAKPVVVVMLADLESDEKDNDDIVEIEITGTFELFPNGIENDTLVLRSETYAPSALYYEKAISVDVDPLSDDFSKDTYMLLEDIVFPQKALQVNGLYAGDADYALEYKTLLKFKNLADEDKESYHYLTAFALYTALLEHYTTSIEPSSVTTIAFSGDIMAGRGVDGTLQRQNGVETVFADTLPIFVNSDLAIGNLEGAVTTHENKVYKSYNFKFPYAVLPKFAEAGFDYLTVANNHSFDFGKQGFLDTLENLEKANFGTSGCGLTLDIALKPWQVELGGTTFNVFSLADYPSEMHFSGREETEVTAESAGVLWPCDELFEIIEDYSVKENSFDIVLVHGGNEWQNLPSQRQIDLYRKLTDSGADIVIGSHPHVLQPLEVNKEALIAYSIGNFIFPGMDETDYGEETIIPQIGVWKNSIKYINLFPVNLSQIGVSLDTTKIIENRFYKMNKAWGEKNEKITQY